MPLCTRLLFLLKLHLGNSIFGGEGREERNDIHKEELGMEMQSKVRRHLQSVLDDGLKSIGNRTFVGTERKAWASGMTGSLPDHKGDWTPIFLCHESKGCAFLNT